MTLNTITNEQTLMIEKAMQHYIGLDTISKMGKDRYTKISNELLNLLSDIDIYHIEWNSKMDWFDYLSY